MTDGNQLKVVTISPGPASAGGMAHHTKGTKVILSDGSELSGVTRITLHAEPKDVWKAVIEVYPETVQVVAAEATTCVVEVTALADEQRRYAMGQNTEGCSEMPSEGIVLLELGEQVDPLGL
uniref:Uncharacterized protein n=1 Tax=Pseudomonas graminis TaxID=158627 RepID=A0A7C1X4M6_9PSED